MLIARLKLFLYFLFIIQCTKIELCDDYDFQSQDCTNHPTNMILEIQKNQTFQDFCNNLYFHQKWTIGILFKPSQFNTSITNSVKCLYWITTHDQNLKNFSSELEGNRWINQDFWCFDYLGSMLSHFYHINHLDSFTMEKLHLEQQSLIIQLDLSFHGIQQKNFTRIITIKNLY